jgi:hypothetical protein
VINVVPLSEARNDRILVIEPHRAS